MGKLTEEEKQKLKERVQEASTHRTNRILDNSATASLQELTLKNILRFVHQSFVWRFLAIYQGSAFGYSAFFLLALTPLKGNVWLRSLVFIAFGLAGVVLGSLTLFNADKIWKRVCLACGAVIATVLLWLLGRILSAQIQEVPSPPVVLRGIQWVAGRLWRP